MIASNGSARDGAEHSYLGLADELIFQNSK
jgi:hypothetical protein